MGAPGTGPPGDDHYASEWLAGTVTGVATVARDLTERNRAEASQRALEDRVHQAERLETVGQLAGGIAHDPMPGLPPVLADGGSWSRCCSAWLSTRVMRCRRVVS